MKVTRLTIANFRGVRTATIDFDGHSLLIGENNAGKSTICEALDLVLGPDRLGRHPVIDEHDFHEGRYLDGEGKPVSLVIEALLTDLSPDYVRRYRANLEFWDVANRKLIEGADGPEATDQEGVVSALRVRFVGSYDAKDDEFKGQTILCHPQTDPPIFFSKEAKRECGFLYLRTIRTGSRALSLERGSLLDIAVRLKTDDQAGMWEATLAKLREIDPPIHKIDALDSVLSAVDQQVRQFIGLSASPEALRLYPNQLTREHLRKTVSFFAATADTETHVPYHRLGTGTINAFIFALLTQIAELKKNVIFAMEEPEIAIPPHTQRRLVQYALQHMDQAIITTHSPYVIEQVSPESMLILRRDTTGSLTGTRVDLGGMKEKQFRAEVRRQFAEGLLGRAVLCVEGITELHVFNAMSEMLSAAEESANQSFELLGVTVIEAGGDGGLEKLGKFFRGIGHSAFAFFDKQKKKTPQKVADIHAAFDKAWEIDVTDIEKLLVEQIPADVQRNFLTAYKDDDTAPDWLPKQDLAVSDDDIRKLTQKTLAERKGYGVAGQLVRTCTIQQLPSKLVEVFSGIGKHLAPMTDATGGQVAAEVPADAAPAVGGSNNGPATDGA